MINARNENEQTDGNLYELNDMLKLSCQDCAGCFACCEGMGSSVVLTPYDVFELERNLGVTFEQLMQEKIELGISDGMILPNLKMAGEREVCGFLNEEGRCSIHTFRPGICRLFPLGRQYGESKINYIFLEHACPKPNKTKVKIKKWLGIPDIEQNENFLLNWHKLKKQAIELMARTREQRLHTQEQSERTQEQKREQEDSMVKELNMYLLNLFYVNPYDVNRDFYLQFEERRNTAEKLLCQLAKQEE